MNSESANLQYINDYIQNIVNEYQFKSHEVVISEKFQKGENFLGEVKRATLNGIKENGEKESLYFIIKTIPESLRGNEVVHLEKIFNTEVYLYNVYLKELLSIQQAANLSDDNDVDVSLNIAKAYVSSDEPGKECLIFQDLNTEGYQMYDRFKSLDFDHLMLAAKVLGHFHALSFAIKNKKSKEEFDEYLSHVYKMEENKDFEVYLRNSADNLINVIDCEENKARFKNFLNGNILEDWRHTIYMKEDRPYNILNHGDFWINNLMFKYENGKPQKMMMLDWQVPKYTTPIVDIFYLLYICIDEETREKHWDDVLDLYYTTLRERLTLLDCDPDICFPESAFRHDLKQFHGFAVVLTLMMLPLILNSKEDSLDLSELLEAGPENYSTVFKYSDIFKKRYNGILRHLIKLNVI